ncbi:MAG: helicase-related protein [Planctomycetota bacterium]
MVNIARESEASIVIWCAFRPEIEAVKGTLCKEFGVDSVTEIHGGVPEAQRAVNIAAFQAGKARFLVGNAAAGGMGIELQAASIVIYYSNTFRYEDRVQSEDRAHRIGQKSSVLYIDLIVPDTVDELVQEALGNKQDVAQYVQQAIADGEGQKKHA